ncbi:hypothetical protein D3C76_1511690 [compost metagenome]
MPARIIRYSSNWAITEITRPSHSAGRMKPRLNWNSIGCHGTNARHANRLAPYCNVSTCVGGCSMRFCRMAPVVMHSNAARANSMPLGAKRDTTRLW